MRNNRLVKGDRIPFTQVPNEIFESGMKMKTIGIYVYMLSKPDGWNFTIRSIKAQINEGYDSIRVALIELKENGWIDYQKNNDGTGVYIIKTQPKLENPIEGSEPKTENPSLEFPINGKSNRINNKDTIVTKIVSNKESEKLNFTEATLFQNDFNQEIEDELIDSILDLARDFDKNQKKEKEKNLPAKKEKELKDRELLKIQDHEVPENELVYFQTARAFQDLFITNLEENGSITTIQKKAKYGNYVKQIRLMVERDGVTNDQFRKLFEFLKVSDFWKSNILSIDKMRKQANRLLIEANKNERKKSTSADVVPTDPAEQYEYYERIKQKLLRGY